MTKRVPTLSPLNEADKSPCVRNCCLDEQDVCLGCGRTLDEIKIWSSVDVDRRAEIKVLAAARVLERRRRFPL